MNISIIEQKEGFVKLQADVTYEGYQEALKKELKRVAQSAKVDGFRSGKVPVGMIEKLYGEGVRLEVINRSVSKALDDFIKEKEFKVIGWAIPEESNVKAMSDRDMTLFFKLALYPTEYDFNFDDKTFTKYEVTITDDDVLKQLEAMQQANATLKETDEVVADSIVGGDLAELDGDTRKEGGIVRENVSIYPQFMKDEEEKKKFLEAGKGSVVVFNPYKAFEGNLAELKSLLSVDEEEVKSLKNTEFSFQIETVRHMVPAELNQEFFDTVFGADKVHNEDEAKEKLREFMQSSENGNADYKFSLDFLDYVKNDKADKLKLADDLIVEWYIDNLKQNNQEDKIEQLDKKSLISSLKRELYIRELANKEGISVADEDIKNFAYEMIRQQFAQMGWHNPDHEIVAKYADQRLADSNFAYSIEMNVLEQKVSKAIQEKVQKETKQVTVQELNELINPAPKNSEEEGSVNSKE